MNAKYISSSGEKFSIFHGCSTSENADMMKCIKYYPQKKFFFLLYSAEIQKAQPNFSPGRFLFDLSFSMCSLGITMGVNIVYT